MRKYIYTYKDNEYEYIGKVLTKHPVTRDWVDAVHYKSLTKHSNKTFVRETFEFFSKFIQVVEKNEEPKE